MSGEGDPEPPDGPSSSSSTSSLGFSFWPVGCSVKEHQFEEVLAFVSLLGLCPRLGKQMKPMGHPLQTWCLGPTGHYLFFPPKGSMWRQWSTRTSASQFGMWVARTRFGLSGDTTSRTPKVRLMTCPGTGLGWLGVSKECGCHSWLWVVNPGSAVAPVGGRRGANVANIWKI